MVSTPADDEASESAPTVDRTAVRERLRRVNDPELDRSIVDLEYVERIAIDGDQVTVTFVLPTAWCSPAFAWMMATGIRDEVTSLSGVSDVTVELEDHMHGTEITSGVNERHAFQDVFPDAEDDVTAVRRKLDEKARLARQYRAGEALLDAGVDPEQAATLTRGDLDLDFESDRGALALPDTGVVVTVPRAPLADYLEKARATGLVTDPDDHLFADPDGNPIDPEQFELVHHRARAAHVNAAGQGSVCESLHESRNGVPAED